MTNITDQFRTFMEKHNHPYRGILIINSSKKFERTDCPINVGKNQSLSYYLRTGRADRHYGYFKCFEGTCDGEGTGHYWVEEDESKGFYKLSKEEFKQKLAELHEDMKISAGDILAQEERCAIAAQNQFDQALTHGLELVPYVKDKKFIPYGLKKWGDTLLVPLRDANGKLWNIESIHANHKKFPMTGARVNGLFHMIGELDPNGMLYLSEGIATASIIFEATGSPTACCRNANNLFKAAKAIKQKYPKIKLKVAADDDRFKLEKTKQKLLAEGKKIPPNLVNAGINAALKVMKKFGAEVTTPNFAILGADEMLLRREKSPSDFHDIFYELLQRGSNQEAALLEIRQQIQQNLGISIMTENVKEKKINENKKPANDMENNEQEKPNVEKQEKLKEDLLTEVKRLAGLDKMQYELVRKEIAKKFDIREGVLDEFVNKERQKIEEDKSDTDLFPKIEPWPDTVILSDLLDEIVALLDKYVSFNSNHEPRAIALWVAHTHCIEAAYISAILFVTSAEMRSGKSTLLAILQKLVSNCVAASSITAAVIYRLYKLKRPPTLMCDEADTYLTEKNEDLRGVLNAGHSRDTSGVLRVNHDTHEVEKFDAFGAKCLAGIKGLPATIEDRSIIIKMCRMAKGKKKEKMRLIDEQLRNEFHEIQRKCVKFANDNIETLKTVDPTLPNELNDRAADNWYSLFQIAELASDQWPKYAKDAALSLSGLEQENKSLGVELLEDIQNIFDGKYKSSIDIKTADLIEALCMDDESPWATFNKNRNDPKINPRQLSKLLKPYGIASKNVIRGEERPKGYHKNDFQDAFARYTSADPSNFAATSATSATHNDGGAYNVADKNNASATNRSSSEILVAGSGSERLVADIEKPCEPPSHIAGADVADKNGNLVERRYVDV